jgi:two-component system sensor histidine kinase MprB
VSLRWKVALSMALVALASTVAVGFIGYRSTSVRLIDEVDRSISQAAALLPNRDGRFVVPSRGPLSAYWVRALDVEGSVLGTTFEADLPVGDVERGVLDTGGAAFTTVSGEDASYRVQTIGVRGGGIQVARSLEETDRVLSDLRQRTIILVIVVSVAAAALGWLIAGSVVAPLRRLTRAAEDVAESGRLDVEVPGGTDEVGRLGSAFAQMLGALGRSRDEQQRLVEDAGHELRTPLTSLRTNLAVLQRHPDMPDDMRRRIFSDLDGEVAELTDLVNEVVTVASGATDGQPVERLDPVVVAAEVADRVGRRRGRSISVVGSPGSTVEVSPTGLDRAISNLLENACKFDGGDGPIELVVERGTVTVLDRGPGIDEDDIPKVFDRFHRADSARSMPGSGLGLAIVRDFAERAGGTVFARNRADGGGAAIGFTLPECARGGDRS